MTRLSDLLGICELQLQITKYLDTGALVSLSNTGHAARDPLCESAWQDNYRRACGELSAKRKANALEPPAPVQGPWQQACKKTLLALSKVALTPPEVAVPGDTMTISTRTGRFVEGRPVHQCGDVVEFVRRERAYFVLRTRDGEEVRLSAAHLADGIPATPGPVNKPYRVYRWPNAQLQELCDEVVVGAEVELHHMGALRRWRIVEVEESSSILERTDDPLPPVTLAEIHAAATRRSERLKQSACAQLAQNQTP